MPDDRHPADSFAAGVGLVLALLLVAAASVVVMPAVCSRVFAPWDRR